MNRSAIRRALSRTVAVCAAVSTAMVALVAADGAARTNHAHAASSLDGPITRSEVLARAQNWVDRGVRYNLTRASSTLITDVDGAHRYGPDCSGLVSMAWHISANSGKGGNSTSDFASWTGKIYLSSLHDLKPGDAILKDGHMELFARWKNDSDHSQGAWTYSLNGGDDPDGDGWQNDWAKGPAANSHGQVGSESWSSMQNYRPIRYKNIVDGGGDGSPSIDGDGSADILARYTDGTLHWYPNKGDGTFWSARDLGPAPGFQLMAMGDIDGDGSADILARYTDGTLHWYPNKGDGTFWSARDLGPAPGFQLMAMGDIDGDGSADILARYTDGTLHWYPNKGDGTFWSARDLGPAPGFQLMAMGDIDGDGSADILARYTDGTLHWYPNKGDGTFWSARDLGPAPGFQLMAL
ncbi:VCBS repeat-containing protein [Sphaerisporangium sp. B11E5]|uniref:FG-GAP repeat domain-containing protein n=1 Tax=Sphaerisporangium sp. B11E5 TaxID=3153563 RepID=UPI00325E1247